LLFIEVAIWSCGPVLLCLLNYIIEIIQATKGCRYFP
jgi:hypothetical protein